LGQKKEVIVAITLESGFWGVLSSVRVEGVRWVTWPNKRPSTSPREVVMRYIKADNVGPDIVIFWNGRSSMAREIERERGRVRESARYWERRVCFFGLREKIRNGVVLMAGQ